MSNREELMRLLEMMESSNDIDNSQENPGEVAQRLRQAYDTLMVEHRFAPGELVTWKSGLKNRRIPNEGTPVIVIQHADEPIFRNTDCGPGASVFLEPLDLVVGMVEPDGDFGIFHVDSRRFRRYESG